MQKYMQQAIEPSISTRLRSSLSTILRSAEEFSWLGILTFWKARALYGRVPKSPLVDLRKMEHTA